MRPKWATIIATRGANTKMSKHLEDTWEKFSRRCAEEFDTATTEGDEQAFLEKAKDHNGHEKRINVAYYGEDDDVWNVAIECERCFILLFDSDMLENGSETPTPADKMGRI